MSAKSTGRPGTSTAPFAAPPPVASARARSVVEAGDRLGGFFALSTRPAEAADPSWAPLSTLLAPIGADDPLGRRIEEVAAQLGGAPRRVAASLLSISLAARPVSVLLAAAAEHRVLLGLPHDVLCWRPWSGGPLPLWVGPDAVTGGELGAPGDPATAALLAGELVDVHLDPLVAAIRARVAVSPRVLWGNAVSALAGAVRVLAVERPAVRDDALALARGVLAREAFAGLGSFVPEPTHPTGFGFARRTCCLYYRLPGGGMCGDCVLAYR